MFYAEMTNKSDVCNIYGMCFSQQKLHVLATFMSLQLQTASIMVRNNECTLPQYIHLLPIQNSPNFAQPHTNTEIPGEPPSSNIEKYSNNETTPNTSYSEEISRTKLDSKETSSASEITPPRSHSHISSTSSTSSITTVENEWKHAKPLSNKRQKEKHSSPGSNASRTSSSNGSAHHARSKAHSKETVTASTTSVSKDLASSALPSSAKGKHKLIVYTQLL